MSRLLIVSNRLPVSVEKTKRGLRFQSSVGGLATGLRTFYKSYDATWIGWPGIDLEEIKNDVETRDKTDMTRKVAPLKKAKDAIAIDTTNMTVEEVTKKVLWIVKSQR